jgi:hypothetical protein
MKAAMRIAEEDDLRLMLAQRRKVASVTMIELASVISACALVCRVFSTRTWSAAEGHIHLRFVREHCNERNAFFACEI